MIRHNQPTPKRDIREVWAYNLKEELANIREVIVHYPYVAMDTEFPGIVARPVGNFKTSAEYTYQQLRCNVDLLKLIQLGLTFSDSQGNVPPDTCTWQFNFKFSLNDDMFAPESIELLQRSGIDFKRFEQNGINVAEFGELIIPSGLVLMDEVKWIAFHSGYDFAYFLKLLTCQALPATEKEFQTLVRIYFPSIYDIKYIMQSCKNLKGGLQDVANELQVERIGPQHQAGSDSMLTLYTFIALRHLYFDDQLDDAKFCGHLFGLTTTFASHFDGADDLERVKQ